MEPEESRCATCGSTTSLHSTETSASAHRNSSPWTEETTTATMNPVTQDGLLDQPRCSIPEPTESLNGRGKSYHSPPSAAKQIPATHPCTSESSLKAWIYMRRLRIAAPVDSHSSSVLLSMGHTRIIESRTSRETDRGRSLRRETLRTVGDYSLGAATPHPSLDDTTYPRFRLLVSLS